MINIKDISIIQYSSLLELGTEAGEAIKIQSNVKKLCKKYKLHKDTVKELLQYPLQAQVKFLETIATFGGFN